MSLPHNTRLSQQKNNRLRIAVSACLLGQKVRYDGGDKRHDFVCRVLAKLAELVPVCPEVEIGLGVPRPPIHLVDNGARLKAIGVTDQALDVTPQLDQFGQIAARHLSGIDGYIFKARSPSCGVTSTPISLGRGRYRKGAGLFAAQIMRRMPLLPVTEETALEYTDDHIHFIQRVEAYRGLRELLAQRPGYQQLHDFHLDQRLSLMAHGREGLREIDYWIACLPKGEKLRNNQRQEYGRLFMRQFTRRATHRRHLVVLHHLASRVRKGMQKAQYNRLLELIDAFAQEKVELVRVMAQLRALLQLESQADLRRQSYLQQSLCFKL